MTEFVFVLAGFLFGVLITTLVFISRSTSGTLKIDRTNPDKDVYRLDVDDLDHLAKKRRVVLKIDPHADLSHH